MIVDEMMHNLYKISGGTLLHIFWGNDLEILCKMDLKYESSNCLEEDDPNYKEFYACCVEIIKIIKSNDLFDKKEGDFIEVSIDNEPSRIELEDGTLVWEKYKI